jgi:hypothetical protein
MDPDASESAAVPPKFGVPVAAASTIGPMIFQFYPLPGLPSEGDHFYYNQEVDLSCGNFAALVAYAAHYNLPLVVHACPNIAAFQVAHPRANICPFSKVSPRILSRGRELFALAHLAAQAAPVILPLVAHSMLSSCKGLLSRGLSSLLSPASLLAASRDADPPSLPRSSISSLAVSKGQFSQVSVSSTLAHTALTLTVSALPPLLGGVGLVSGLLVLKGGDFILLVPIGSFLLQLIPHGGIPPPAHGGHPTHTPHGGIPPSAHGGLPTHAPHPLGGGFVSLESTAKHWRAFTLPGSVLPNVPSFIHGGGVLVPPIYFHSPHASSSVVLSLGVSSSTLIFLPHEDALFFLASNITMSFLVPVPPMASSHSLPLAPTEISHAPQASAPALATGSLWLSESIKLPDIKDAKDYLDNYELIQDYLWLPNYSTQSSDSLLITDASNSEAS